MIGRQLSLPFDELLADLCCWLSGYSGAAAGERDDDDGKMLTSTATPPGRIMKMMTIAVGRRGTGMNQRGE